MKVAAAICVLAVFAAATMAFAEDKPAILSPPSATLCSGPFPDTADDFRSSYCEVLKTTREPVAPLQDVGKNVESYRLLYMRSFDPVIVLRLEIQSDTGASLRAVEVRTHSDQIQLARTAFLTPEQIAKFRAFIVAQNFWTAPTEFHLVMGFGPFATKVSDAVVMSDGAQWIIEGMDAGCYHVMGDDGGAFESPVREIGMAMLNLAEKKFPELDVKPIY